MTTNVKITRKELANILGVHYNTACKEYKILLDCLNVNRSYLLKNDLVTLQIITNK